MTDAPGPEASGRLPDLASEWLDYACYYAEVRADEVRAAAKESVRDAVSEFSLTLGAHLVIGAGGVLAFVGLALGLGEWLGGRPWAGWLLSGLLLAALGATGLALHSRRQRRQALDRTRRKYEERQQQQRTRHGRTVADRAREDRPPADDDRTGIPA